MNPNLHWLSDFPPQKRMGLFLSDALDGEDHDERVRQLATDLGYKNAAPVKMWTTGAAKVPLRMLIPLAQHTGRDVSEWLPLWIAAEIGSDDADQLYKASQRMLSIWEWGLVAVARDIYRGDDLDLVPINE
jgi:hypothetical protein